MRIFVILWAFVRIEIFFALSVYIWAYVYEGISFQVSRCHSSDFLFAVLVLCLNKHRCLRLYTDFNRNSRKMHKDYFYISCINTCVLQLRVQNFKGEIITNQVKWQHVKLVAELLVRMRTQAIVFCSHKYRCTNDYI